MSHQPVMLPQHLRPVEVPLVRLGARFDGGYVVAEQTVRLANSLLSFGVETDWSFEADFAAVKVPDFRIDCYDPTAVRNLSNPHSLVRRLNQIVRGKRHWRHLSIASSAGYRSFFNGKSATMHEIWIGAPDATPKPSLTFSQVMASANPRPPVFVKMDIEGSEWDVLDDIAAAADAICGLAIEFHGLDNGVRSLDAAHPLFERFAVCNIHANNNVPAFETFPDVIEMSLVNRRLLPANVVLAERPSPLNRPNRRLSPMIPFAFG